MKTKHKVRIVADSAAAVTLFTGAVVALVLAPEIGIAIAPPMISAALANIKDARQTYRNRNAFFNQQNKELDNDELPSPQNSHSL